MVVEKNNKMIRKQIDYSIVIPVYNSENSLKELCLRIKKVFKLITNNYEIIFIDDNSQDDSWDILNKLHEKDRKVKIIRLMKNFGQQNAIMCGFNYTLGKYVITMDDDLQHPPEEIPKLIMAINKKYDVVYGQYIKKEHNYFRNFGTFFINLIIKKIAQRHINITSFRIINNIVINKIVKYKNYNVMIDVCISNIVPNEKIGFITVKHNKRKFGKTQYSFNRLFSFAINLIMNYSTFPLKIASFIGLICSLLSFTIALILLINYFHNQINVSGWTSLILSIIFFSGIILFVLGIIGEYISKIFWNLNSKPQYETREIKNEK